MQPRIDYVKAAPNGVRAMYGLETYLRNCGLEKPLLESVKTRVSQLNGCAFCIDMHTKDARCAGETEQRLYALSAWRETPFYTDCERAALSWAEVITLISSTHASNDVYEEVHQHFSETELVNLTLAITTINAWNRLGIGFRSVPGTYQPSGHAGAQV
jgi:AhpD family alkylhydroperoxidase